MLTQLQDRELKRAADQLSGELGLAYTEAKSGTRIEGIYRRHVDLASGRFAVIEKSREFTLVPWRPVLERNLGRSVSGACAAMQSRGRSDGSAEDQQSGETCRKQG